MDSLGSWAEEADENDSSADEYKLVGAGIQISGSASCVVVSGGGGIEVIVYWDTPEAKAKGKPIVAVYVYGEIDGVIDVESLDEIIELLYDSVDVMKMDGVNALEAIAAGISFEASISVFGVEANSNFYGVQDYTGSFQNKSVNAGSLSISKAWSETCQTIGVGYTYAVGQPALRFKLPSYSRGCSYYWLLWSSNQLK